MASCNACGIESANLLKIFRGESVGEKLPLCADCVAMGVSDLHFLSDKDVKLAPRTVLERVVRANRPVLKALYEAREESSRLEARIAALEIALT